MAGTTVRAAGLSNPQLVLEARTEGGPQAAAWGWANVVALELLRVPPRELQRLVGHDDLARVAQLPGA